MALSWMIGCQEADVVDRGVTVRDSAGITIVRTELPADSSAWGPGSIRPLFRVGWENGEPEFRSIRAGTVMANGDIAIADRDRVVVLDSTGVMVREFGRAGEGPGEFTAINNVIALCGDSLLVHDHAQQRVSVFSKGELLSTSRLTPPGNFRHVVMGRAADGSLILLPTGAVRFPGDPDEWYEVPFLRTTLDRSEFDTIATADFRRYGFEMNPFVAIGWSAVTGGAIVHVRGDRPQAEWRSSDGELRKISRWTPAWVQLTEALWPEYAEDFRNRRVDRWTEAEIAQSLDEMRSAAPARLPLYSRIWGDPDGNLWMQRYSPFRTISNLFEVLDSDGVWRERGHLPIQLQCSLLRRPDGDWGRT